MALPILFLAFLPGKDAGASAGGGLRAVHRLMGMMTVHTGEERAALLAARPVTAFILTETKGGRSLLSKIEEGRIRRLDRGFSESLLARLEGVVREFDLMIARRAYGIDAQTFLRAAADEALAGLRTQGNPYYGAYFTGPHPTRSGSLVERFLTGNPDLSETYRFPRDASAIQS